MYKQIPQSVNSLDNKKKGKNKTFVNENNFTNKLQENKGESKIKNANNKNVDTKRNGFINVNEKNKIKYFNNNKENINSNISNRENNNKIPYQNKNINENLKKNLICKEKKNFTEKNKISLIDNFWKFAEKEKLRIAEKIFKNVFAENPNDKNKQETKIAKDNNEGFMLNKSNKLEIKNDKENILPQNLPQIYNAYNQNLNLQPNNFYNQNLNSNMNMSYCNNYYQQPYFYNHNQNFKKFDLVYQRDNFQQINKEKKVAFLEENKNAFQTPNETINFSNAANNFQNFGILNTNASLYIPKKK